MRGTMWLACTLSVLALSAPARAQTAETLNQTAPRALSLDQAIDVAVRQSPDLARTRIDREIAAAEVKAASGIDDWVITASGAWLSSRAGIVEGQPFQNIATDSISGEGSLSRQLPTGGTVGIHANAGFRRDDFAVLAQLDPGSPATMEIFPAKTSTIGISARLRQPLLRGRGRRIARANVRRARVATDRATVARQSSANNMVQSIVSAYWELAYSARELEIRKAALDLAREQLRMTRVERRAGTKSDSDLRAIEYGVASREQAVLQARIAVSGRSLELRKLVGLEIGPGQIGLVASDKLVPRARRIDLDEALRQARQHNPSLALIRLQRKEARIDEEVAADQRAPSLDLSAEAGPAGIASAFRDATKQLVSFDSYSVSATLSYNQNLGNRTAAGNYERARLLRRRLGFDLAVTERDIAVRVVRAVNLVRLAKKRIEVADKAIALAVKNLADEKLRFAANEATNFDVLQRQDEIQKARLDRARAVVDYLKSLGTVDALTGALLARYGVEVVPRRR